MKIQRKSLFLFWAWMDLFFVLQFLWWNIAHRRLPFYDDLLAYLQLLHTYGSGAVWLYPLNVLLIISIPLSMILFFRQSRYALWLAWGQAPLQTGVYAAFAVAGSVADSGCRHQACSDPGRFSAAL